MADLIPTWFLLNSRNRFPHSPFEIIGSENACQDLSYMVQIFGWENKKNIHTTKNTRYSMYCILQFPTVIPVIHFMADIYKYTFYSFMKPKTIFENANCFSCLRAFCFGKDDLWEHLSSLLYTQYIYLKQFYPCLSMNINLSLLCSSLVNIYKTVLRKVYIIMTPYCGHVRISSIFCRQMTRYPPKLSWLHL